MPKPNEAEMDKAAESLEAKGLMFRWRNEAGEEFWELTPLGHRFMKTGKEPSLN